MNKTLIKIILCMAIFTIAGLAYGQQTTSSSVQPPPAIFFKLGTTGIAGDQQFLYVAAGAKILQYEISGMTLLRTVDLPDATPPQGTPPKPPESGSLPPPPPPLPHGLWEGNGFLYVLGGPFVYVYSVPDLTLQNTVQLPKPDLPQASD